MPNCRVMDCRLDRGIQDPPVPMMQLGCPRIPRMTIRQSNAFSLSLLLEPQVENNTDAPAR